MRGFHINTILIVKRTQKSNGRGDGGKPRHAQEWNRTKLEITDTQYELKISVNSLMYKEVILLSAPAMKTGQAPADGREPFHVYGLQHSSSSYHLILNVLCFPSSHTREQYTSIRKAQAHLALQISNISEQSLSVRVADCTHKNTWKRKSGEKLGRPGIIHHVNDIIELHVLTNKKLAFELSLYIARWNVFRRSLMNCTICIVQSICVTAHTSIGSGWVKLTAILLMYS